MENEENSFRSGLDGRRAFGILPGLAAVMLAGCVNGISMDTSDSVMDVLDTADTGDTFETWDTSDTDDIDDTDDTVDTGDTGVEGCPEAGGQVYNWQWSGFYEDPAKIAEVAGLTGFTNGIITTSPPYIEWLAGNFEEAGLRFTPQLVSWSEYTTDDGYFDFAAWEAKLFEYEDLDLNYYIDSGVIDGVLLLDDLGNFADEGPDSATLDAMGAVVKEVFEIDDDNFAIIVRHDASDMLLKHEGHDFQHVNRVYVQMSALKAEGDLKGLLEDEKAATEELGLEPIWAVNGLDWEKLEDTGGDECPSGYAGYRDGFCVVPADVFKEEAALIAEEGGCNKGTGFWRVSEDGVADWSFLLEDSLYLDGFAGLAEAAD
jgi:hypothetical protein